TRSGERGTPGAGVASQAAVGSAEGVAPDADGRAESEARTPGAGVHPEPDAGSEKRSRSGLESLPERECRAHPTRRRVSRRNRLARSVMTLVLALPVRMRRMSR